MGGEIPDCVASDKGIETIKTGGVATHHHGSGRRRGGDMLRTGDRAHTPAATGAGTKVTTAVHHNGLKASECFSPDTGDVGIRLGSLHADPNGVAFARYAWITDVNVVIAGGKVLPRS